MGFRPFVYRLALRFGIAGFVGNTSDGVVIEAEGACVKGFLDALRDDLPPLARIDELRVTVLACTGDLAFTIAQSDAAARGFAVGLAMIPPDIATCPECLAEIAAPGDRRFGYAFTNCTNCGPRYSIIRNIPYDRARTTMSEFPMCEQCAKEYADPLHRRFHAEPNACPDCGPSLTLLHSDELSMVEILARVRHLLRGGKIIAMKGLGGFQLVCDATDNQAVGTLRARKRRNGKAFAVMAGSIEIVERFCEVDEGERALLAGSKRPIVLLKRKGALAADVAPGNVRLGVMLPYTPLHQLLFADGLEVLVMTSGNLADEPIVYRNEDAYNQLHPLADHFLLHNRKIHTRVDDSVMQVFEGREYAVRRSRGYAPEPIDLGFDLAEVLACGGELKNTLCLTKGRHAILSQHIGDLENLETMAFFRETLDHLRNFFHVDPIAVAHDLHPNYLGTRYALRESGLRPIGVQHHHAHIASCMAENGLRKAVIGVAMDGTGYGTDETIWGGEFLVCDYLHFERRGHFRTISMAGGDAAIRQPWRSGLAYLRETFGELAGTMSPRLVRGVSAERIRVVERMMARRLQTVETSSCGRLFDAVASLLGIRQETGYEGQAAMELEAAATAAPGRYPFEIGLQDTFQVDFRPTIEAIVNDVTQGLATGEISARFHATVAEAIVEGCLRIREGNGMEHVCLSGGTFQNLRLLGLTVAGLRGRGFTVHTHGRVPTNDGGLALGQAVIASHILLWNNPVFCRLC